MRLPADTRQSLLSKYHTAGIKIVASAFGSTEHPTSEGADPTQRANTFAEFILQYQLGGIDVDYEDSGAIDKRDGTAEKWLITTFTQTLRQKLPQGKYLLTHARRFSSSMKRPLTNRIHHSTCALVLNRIS